MTHCLYITATLPALTVTFIYNEIFGLEAEGVEVGTVSMNTPPASDVSPEAAHLLESTRYLDQVSGSAKFAAFVRTFVRHPVRMSRCLWLVLAASPMQGVRDYVRLSYHLVEAAYLADRMRDDLPAHIHSHLINGPTSLAMFLGQLTGVSYSFTMHASMIWLDPIAFRQKLETCAFGVSISEFNRRYVIDTYGSQFAEKLHVIHCGIDPDSAPSPEPSDRASAVLRIVGVGQLNRRKGFHILIDALASLADTHAGRFTCDIIGDGDERQRLEKQILDRGLAGTVTLRGAMTHEKVVEELRRSDLFALPCTIAEDGWRDGIPVALMEAMSLCIPVVTTKILGLPELVEDGVSGRLVPNDDPAALANALAGLIDDGGLRRQLGANGRDKVLAEFNNQKSVQQLLRLFRTRGRV